MRLQQLTVCAHATLGRRSLRAPGGSIPRSHWHEGLSNHLANDGTCLQLPLRRRKAIGSLARDSEMSGARQEITIDGLTYRWRGPLTDAEMVDLTRAHQGRAVPGWWDRIRDTSLGWVTARTTDGDVVGFVNVAWDGGDHAFLLDTKTHGRFQHRGIATRVVALAVHHAKDAGCEWLHVDFDSGLEPFYFDACGFTPTPAGVIHLRSFGNAED